MTHPPEPWTLTGRMDASTFLVPTRALPRRSAPAGHVPVVLGGRAVVTVAWVDYDEGGMMSYRELLATVLVRRGRAVRPHITDIWVDSPASRDGGRALWGIPKGLAAFDAAAPGHDPADGVRRCTPEGADRPVATATARRGRRLPGRLPVRFAVAQHAAVAGVGGFDALVSPVATRTALGPATLAWEFDPDGVLGHLAGRRPAVSTALHDFAMLFGMTARRPRPPLGPGVAATARGRRLEPDARREEILDGASRLFGDRPYAAVSLVEVAREVGVARGLVNHYFGTKRDLYLEVVRRLTTIPADAVEDLPAGTRADRAGAAVDWFLDTVERRRGLWLAVGAGSGAGDDPELDAVLAEADEVAVDRVVVALLAPDGDAEPVGPLVRARLRSFFGLVRAASREWLVRGSLDRVQTRALLVEVLLVVLDEPSPHASPSSHV